MKNIDQNRQKTNFTSLDQSVKGVEFGIPPSCVVAWSQGQDFQLYTVGRSC